MCKLELNKVTYAIANIYAHNDVKPEFITYVMDQVKQLNCVYNIIGGDFNFVMDNNIDRNNIVWYNKPARDKMLEIMEAENMIDVWRVCYPEKKAFTWMQRKNKGSWSRLDMFITSSNVNNICESAEILPCILTDHSLVCLTLDTNEGKRGPGNWKFNIKLLRDEFFCENIECIIKGVC